MEHGTAELFCMVPFGAADGRFVLKGTEPAYAPSRAFDTEHIKLELEVDLLRESFTGRATTTLRALRRENQELVFDAVNFKISAVRVNGRAASYTYKNNLINVALKNAVAEGAAITVQIDYKVSRPALGMFFIKPDKNYPQRPRQAWTQGEDEYARYWFPCHDAPHERTTTELIATVPAGYVAVSNGRLVKSSRGRGKAVYHWKQEIPHATYLVTLTVGKFSLIKDNWRGVPVEYYCERGREADTLRAFSKTPKMLEFFSSSIGVKYPYAKYAQIAAHDFIFGGMENTSATTQTEYALLDERAALDYSSDDLVAHELAHQWFGDYLTCKDWGHAWLNESFATYMDPLFKRFDKGEDEFLYAIRGNMREYLAEDKERYRRSIATGTYRRPSDLFDRHLYEKGSVVLFMLHRILGERLFWKAINIYVRDNKARVVETADLINAIEKATGYNMRKFFDQWVFGPGHPDFTVNAWWDAAKKELNVRLVQSHAQGSGVGLFTVETEFAFLVKGTEKREKVTIDKKAHLFKFPLAAEPEMVLFDPDHRVLKTVNFNKPEAWLLKQLAKDKNVLGRIDAAQELARRNSPGTLDILKKTLLNDLFWGVRAETARAIGAIGTEEAATVLVHCLDVIDHPKVRRAIYEGLRHTKSKSAADYVEKCFRKEKSYFVEAEGVRLLSALRHPKAKAVIEETLKKESWNDVLRQAALEAMAISRNAAWIPTLLNHTKPGHHQRLRMAALRALMQFKPATEAVRNRLVDLTTDTFLLMQTAAARALQELGDERAVPALKKLTTGDRDGRLKRLAEEAINKLTKGFES